MKYDYLFTLLIKGYLLPTAYLNSLKAATHLGDIFDIRDQVTKIGYTRYHTKILISL